MGDGFGLFVLFGRFEETHFQNVATKKSKSKPRGGRKNRDRNEKRRTIAKNIKDCEFNMDTGYMELLFADGSVIAIDCALTWRTK